MDPLVQVALITALAGVVTAWIARPVRKERARLARIEAHTEKTGNGFAGHVLQGLKEIREEQKTQSSRLYRLEGRLDQFIDDTRR